jgi:hypothetical protein
MNSKLEKVWQVIKDWSDVLFILPVMILAVVFNAAIFEYFDVSTNVMVLDAGFLAVLLRNLVLWSAVSIGSYYLAQTYFGFDIFKRGFFDRLSAFQGAIISIILWIFTVTFSCLVLLRGLLW